MGPSEGRLEYQMYSNQYLESQLAVALGGRLAEEIIYGEDAVTTGASNDIQQVTQLGMSSKIGTVAIEEPGMSQMQKMMMPNGSMWGPNKLRIVEDEVERLVNNSYMMAKRILLENMDLFEELTAALLEREVVSAEEFQMMLYNNKSKSIDYELIGTETNRDKLPFAELPPTV